MSRSHGPAPNNRWQAPRQLSPGQESDRLRAQQQQPLGPGQMNPPQPPQQDPYGQNGYPQQPPPGYHYPQAPAAPEYEPYQTTQAPYPEQPDYGDPGSVADPYAGQEPSFGHPEGAQYAHPAEPHLEPQGISQPDQWQAPPTSQDPRGYDLGSYMPAGTSREEAPAYHGEPPQPPQMDWSHQLVPAGHGEMPPEQAYHGYDAQQGFEQPHAGALDQVDPNYPHEEGGEYEVEEPRRGSWTMRIAGAVVVAIGLGYGLAQGYKLIVGSSPDGATPVIRGSAEPARVKPTDPGGKQFAHTDSKVMGRLGQGGAGSQSDAATEPDGTRKVTTLTVGRDGSIVPPAAPAAADTGEPSISVPGMTVVGGFGGPSPTSGGTRSDVNPLLSSVTQQAAAPAASSTPSKPVVVNSPDAAQKPVVIAKTTPVKKPSPAAAKPAAPKKPAPAPNSTARTSTGSNGYVAVLASVPVSAQSRLAALQRFADMQQRYGSVLLNKTPDIREANLGAKGTYHRLLVGPPGSRAQASTLCSQLKSAGYTDCWVTAY